MKYIILLSLFCAVQSYAKPEYIFLGTDRTGIAISPQKAIEHARPMFYKSFKLRNPSSSLTKAEYESSDTFHAYVYLKKGYYVIFRDMPRKMYSQHYAFPVLVNIQTGEASLGE